MMSEGFGSNFKPFSSPASIPGQSESSCSAGSIGSYPSGAESTMFTGVPATSLEDNAVVPKTCSTNDMDHAVTVDHTGYVMMPHLSRSGSNQSLDSGTAMEDVICKCPCGRTDFSHILNPLPDCLANRHSDSRSFPELDMKSSNEIAQDQLKMKLERQTRIIKQEFITFGLAVRRYAKSIPGIENILKECLSLGREVVEALDFDNLYPKFREGADLINFDILSRCLTHLKLSDESGEENELRRVAEEAAEKYEASFQEFAQQRVVLVPTILQDANGRSNSVYKELKIKVEEDFQSFLVKRSFDFKEVLKRILKLAPDVYLRITSVREGCVEICFEMIGSHADTHFSLNDVQKQEMLANKITLLEYDGQVSYCCCELVSDESSRDTIKKVYNAVCLADYQKDEVDDVDGSNEHTLGCPCLSPQASIENVCSIEECPSCRIRLRRCSLEYHLLQCKRSDSSCPSSSDESDTEELPCAKQNGILPIMELIATVIELLSSRAVVDLATKRPKALTRSPPYYLMDLHTAAKAGDLSALQHAIRRGDDVNSVDKDGYTPLMWAAMGGHTDTVRGLLSSGAVVDLADKNGWTPLTWAAIGGHTDTVRELLSSGAVVDLADENGWTPLMWAASAGHTDCIRELLSSGAVVDLADKDGETPLMRAISGGHTDCAIELLSSGAVVDLADKRRQKVLATSPVDPTHETTEQFKKELESNVRQIKNVDCEPRAPRALYICPVCHCRESHSHQVTCCGKKFCKACIEHIKATKKPCPNCNKSFKQSFYNYQKDGFEWTRELRQLDEHLNTDPLPETQLDGCPLTIINCDFHHVGCAVKLPRQDMPEHAYLRFRSQQAEIAVKLPRQDMPEHQRENLFTDISLLATNTRLTDEQLNQRISEKDVSKIADLFDSIDDLCDQFELSKANKADVKTQQLLRGTKTAAKKALKLWREQNPYKATFKNLLIILLDNKKGGVAKDVAEYIVRYQQKLRRNEQPRPKEGKGRHYYQYFISKLSALILKTSEPQKENGQLTIEALMIHTGLTDEQVNQEIAEIDLPEIVDLFGTTFNFFKQFGLLPAETADVRRLQNVEDTEESVIKARREQDPYKATFKNLLTILLDMDKEGVAKNVAYYI